MRSRRTAATTSPAEFEQQRDVARVLDGARRATAAMQGKPVEELGELAWVGRTENTGLEFRVIRDSALEIEDDDELDRFYGPNGGFWE